MLKPVVRPSRISTLGFTLFIAWVPPKSEKPSSTSYVAGCDVFARFLQGGSGGAWLHQKSCRAPGGRGCAKNPADRKLTLSSRFAFHSDGSIVFFRTRPLARTFSMRVSTKVFLYHDSFTRKFDTAGSAHYSLRTAMRSFSREQSGGAPHK